MAFQLAMRKFLTWLLMVVLVSVSGAIGAYYLAKKYEEPVRNYIVGEVNKRLMSPVHVSDINFSVWERFPSASLVMDSVWANENIVKMGAADTLFFFRKVYLNLNLFDVINGDYKINEIEVKDGFVHLFVDDEGYDNYHIWKSGSDTTGFLLELDKVHAEHTALQYVNRARQQVYRILTDDLYFKGRFSDESYTMAVHGDGFVHQISLRETDYMLDRQVHVETEFDVQSAEERYAFRSGELSIDGNLNFLISGSFVGDGVDLHIKGDDLDIIRTLALIPTESRRMFDGYSSSGVLNFDCTLKGAFGRTESPRMMASFSVDGAEISKDGSNWVLSDLVGGGTIDNGDQKHSKTTVLQINSLHGALNEDSFQTQFRVENFERPQLDGDVTIRSNIQALKEFFSIDWMEEGSGDIDIQAHISTVLDQPSNPQARDFLNAKASGHIAVREGVIKLKDDHRIYRADSADLTIENNALIIDRYIGAINDCALSLQGKADGFLNYFFTEGGGVDVKGRIQTGVINLDELFPSTSDSKSGIVIAFPPRAIWDLEVKAEGFKQGSFVADHIQGRLVMNHFKVEATKLQFLSQEGSVSGKVGVYRFAQNQFGVLTDFVTHDVNVKTLFSTFHNFEQDFITAEVISGKLDANIQFQAFCDSLMNIDLSSVVSSLDLTLKDGALTNFQPLIDVAKELRKKPMMRLFISVDELEKRLSDVRFATLTNELSIRDGVVNIPAMTIESSALNINVEGTHTFDNHIDYAMDFALSEVLELKDRKEPYNQFVHRDNGGKTRIFLTMKGTTDDFEVELERTTLTSDIKRTMVDERNTVKELLKIEFNAIAKDSLRPESNQPAVIEIEFDPEAGSSEEQKSEPTTNKPGSTEASKDKKLLNKLIQRAESDQKKLQEGDFDDDDF